MLTIKQALRQLIEAHDEQPPMLTADHWRAARRALMVSDNETSRLIGKEEREEREEAEASRYLFGDEQISS